MALRIIADSRPPKTDTFGSAKWADITDFQNHGLLDNPAWPSGNPKPVPGNPSGKTPHPGLSLGYFMDGAQALPICYRGDRHLFTIAPTRSGKGTCSVIPNLLTYPGSAVVLDPKSENAIKTAVRRGQGLPTIPGLKQEVYIVDPWDITKVAKPARLNPLDWLKADDPDLAENADLLADALIPHNPTSREPFWEDEARSLLRGIVLHVALDPDEASERTLGRVRDIVSMNTTDFNDILMKMVISPNKTVRSTADRTISKDEKLRSSVVSTMQSHLHFLDSESIRESLSASDFDFADLKKKRMTVYLVLPADRLAPFGRWMRLLIQQALTVNARNIEQKPDLPVLFMLDELAALGKLAMVEQAYGLMAGFGIQLWGIVQDVSQLERIYGRGWETFISNSGVLQYFGSRDQRTAEYFSKLCGMQTVQTSSISNSIQQAVNAVTSSETTNTSNVQRPLAFADELMVMRNQEELVIVENCYPVQGKKVPWYEHPELRRWCP
jgi:type IV secretion system protein VirD4